MDHGQSTGSPACSHCLDLYGEYDLARKDELHALFSALSSSVHAVIDLSRVSYVDSTFLNELALLHFRLKQHGVALIGVRPEIRRLLRIVNFDQLFEIVDA